MRNILTLIIVFCSVLTQAQNYDKIKVGITTCSNLIFPSKIIDFDDGLGVNYDKNGNEIRDILIKKASDNRLKLTAGVEAFETTNLFIETERGYYNFILEYCEFPRKLTHPIKLSQASVIKDLNQDTEEKQEKRKKKKQKKLESQLVSKIKKDRIVSPLDAISTKLGLEFVAEQSYVRDTTMYIKLVLMNKSNVQFGISYVGLSICEKHKGNRKSGVVQKLPKDVRKIYDITSDISLIEDEFPIIEAKSEIQILICLDKFTMEQKKLLEIEIWEADGERKESLKITPKQLVESKII